MRILPTLVLAVAATGFVAAHAADVYRWTDAKGVTHFSDSPPTDTQYQRVNVRTGTTSASGDAAADADAAPASAATGSEQVDARAERCRIARRNLDALRTGFATIAGEDGQPRNLTPEEIDQQRDLNERAIADACQTD